jgi:phage-related protein
MSDTRKTMKSLTWIGSSQKDFRTFPDAVKDEMGYALYQAQMGGKSSDAKPLKGFSGASVLEVVTNDMGNTFRAVYTVKFVMAVYVLHAFQKKSKRGIKTPVEDMKLIEQRFKAAEADYRLQFGKGKLSWHRI